MFFRRYFMKAKVISFFSVLIFGAVICFTGCKSAILVDCNECVSVKFEGYSGSGKATATINKNFIASLLGEMNEYTVASVVNSFSLELIENNGSLLNGDVITVKVKTDSSVLENAGVAVLNAEQEITVSGLKEKEKVDIFKDITFKTNGTSPECSVTFSYSGSACSPYDFQVKTVDGKELSGLKFKNGDKVIISLNDNAVNSLKEKFIIEETSREYTVQADKKYILSANDLSEKDVDALKKISDDFVDNKVNNMDRDSNKSIINGVSGINIGALYASNTEIRKLDNINFNSAYVGIERSEGYFGKITETKYAYFFYTMDITYHPNVGYTFSKEASVDGAALIVRIKNPVIDLTSGEISYSELAIGARKDIDTALSNKLKGDFNKIA